jgi:hypothetical protein
MDVQGLATVIHDLPPANPIGPDSTAQIAAIRCLAIVTASIALGGFIVWYGLGGSETYPELGASIAQHSNDERYLFSETSRGIYVALPPGGIPATSAGSASIPVATPPLPRAKPLQMQVTAQVQDQQPVPTETTTDEATGTDSSIEAPYQPDPAEDIREPSTLDDQMSAQPVQDDETGASHAPPAISDDEPSWQSPTPAESDEGPPADEYAPDEPAGPPESDPPT